MILKINIVYLTLYQSIAQVSIASIFRWGNSVSKNNFIHPSKDGGNGYKYSASWIPLSILAF
jgi:hypothetical protein